MKVVKDVRIDLTTTVSNFVTTNDEVRTRIEGFDCLCQFITVEAYAATGCVGRVPQYTRVRQVLDEGVAGYRT